MFSKQHEIINVRDLIWKKKYILSKINNMKALK